MMRMSHPVWQCLLYSTLVLLFHKGCTLLTYSDLEDESLRRNVSVALSLTPPGLPAARDPNSWNWFRFQDEEQEKGKMSYLYPYEEEPFEEEDQANDCRDLYYDGIALYCWPRFHAAIMSVTESNRCLWENIGSMYGELALCTGLLAEDMGCPLSSPILDVFFVRIHAEYFANCTLPTDAADNQSPTGMAIALATLPVCLMPLCIVLTLRKA